MSDANLYHALDRPEPIGTRALSITSLVIASVFLLSGFLSLADRSPLAVALGGYGVSGRGAEVLAVGVGVIAMTVGGLWLSPLRRLAWWLAVLFLVLGTGHIALIMWWGSPTTCGCGLVLRGLSNSVANTISLTKNILLLGACVVHADVAWRVRNR